MKCSDCKSRKYCDNADKVNYCAGYIFDDSKPKMLTNEQWFCSLSTEEKAKEFVTIQFQERDLCNVITDEMIQSCLKRWEEWLKRPYREVAK